MRNVYFKSFPPIDLKKKATQKANTKGRYDFITPKHGRLWEYLQAGKTLLIDYILAYPNYEIWKAAHSCPVCDKLMPYKYENLDKVFQGSEVLHWLKGMHINECPEQSKLRKYLASLFVV